MVRAKDTAESGGSDLAEAAAGLIDEVATFESLTDRLTRVELVSQEKLAKAGELLNQAGASHVRFVEHLKRLIAGIEDARQRQNASAATLSGITEALDQRRGEYQGIQARFRELGENASEVGDLFHAPDEETSDARETRLSEARTRLQETVDAARSLLDDAKTANFADLEREADALWQRLSSLSKKLDGRSLN